MSRLFYTLVLYALFPFVLLRLLFRARKQASYLSHLPERFGFYKSEQNEKVIWIHAVSVGETRAAAPLLERLMAAYPDFHFLVTHMTPTGRETGEKLYGDRATICYLPYDYPFAVSRFLKHFRPRAGILMETELWFNLIHRCRKYDIPLFLVNARLSEKSLGGYLSIERLAKQGISELAGIAAQTEADAARLERLGAENVSICGNLKFDVPVPEKIEDFRKLLDERPAFLAASTREGEEEAIIEAFEKIEGLLLIIVPRHPQRFGEVEAILKTRGIRYVKRTENRKIDHDTKVFLGDSMNEMYAYYSSCDCAYIGGSLLPFGGQNLIEAASLGKPVFFGPHTYNFEEACDLALRSGAAIRVKNARELADAASALLAAPEKMKEMGEAAIRFASKNRGAVQKIMDLVSPFIGK